MSETSLVRYVIGTSRVKYDTLEKIYRDAGINSKQYRMGVMFVDAHSILYRMFQSRDYGEGDYDSTPEEHVRDIVVGFLNVIGHYRRFMATRLYLDNDIYVLFNPDHSKYHEELCPEYQEDKRQKYNVKSPQYGYHAKAIRQAYQFICGLSQFFEGIYCINCSGIDEYAILGRMDFKPDILYTIFSRSMYTTQFLDTNVVQLFNRRDESRLITAGRCFQDGVLFEKKTRPSGYLKPSMVPILMTFAGCRDVGIGTTKCIRGVASMIKVMNKMADAGILVDGMSFQSFMDAVPPFLKSKKTFYESSAELARRYKIFDARIAGAALTSDQLARVTAQIYDTYNENELEELNELLVTTQQGSDDPNLLEIWNLHMSTALRYDYL